MNASSPWAVRWVRITWVSVDCVQSEEERPYCIHFLPPVHCNGDCTVVAERSWLSSPKSAFILLLWNQRNRFFCPCLIFVAFVTVCCFLCLENIPQVSETPLSQLFLQPRRAPLRFSLCTELAPQPQKWPVCPQCFRSPAHVPFERSFLPQECKPALSVPSEHTRAPSDPGGHMPPAPPATLMVLALTAGVPGGASLQIPLSCCPGVFLC